MVVWDKPWEQYREVQWDQVDCEPQPTSAAPLIGAGDHDFVPHSSESSLLGEGDHDMVPHGSLSRSSFVMYSLSNCGPCNLAPRRPDFEAFFT